jgi:predicted PurR-regulated permease PerM
MFKTTQSLDISWQSILRFYVILLSFVAAWYFRQVIFIILVGFVMASLLDRPIDYFEKKWKNRWLATFIIYFLFLIGLGLIACLFIPVFNNHIVGFMDFFPSWMNKGAFLQLWQGWQPAELSMQNWLSLLGISQGQLSEFLLQSGNLLTKILGGAFSAFFVLLLSFFINTEKKGIEKAIRLIFPSVYEDYVIHLWGRARRKVGSWFFSQSILSGIVGGLVYISLKIVGVPQAEFLAILAALFDFIPYIGPLIIGFIAFLVGISQSFFLGISILIIFIIIQLIEGFISPILRAKTMKLNPLVIILAVLIGGKLAGVVGIIIALPLAAAAIGLIRDIQTGHIATYLPQKKLL